MPRRRTIAVCSAESSAIGTGPLSTAVSRWQPRNFTSSRIVDAAVDRCRGLTRSCFHANTTDRVAFASRRRRCRVFAPGEVIARAISVNVLLAGSPTALARDAYRVEKPFDLRALGWNRLSLIVGREALTEVDPSALTGHRRSISVPVGSWVFTAPAPWPRLVLTHRPGLPLCCVTLQLSPKVGPLSSPSSLRALSTATRARERAQASRLRFLGERPDLEDDRRLIPPVVDGLVMRPDADRSMRRTPNGDATNALHELGVRTAGQAAREGPRVRDEALSVRAAQHGGDLFVTHGRPPH